MHIEYRSRQQWGRKRLYEINKIHPVSILQTSANQSNEMYSNNSIHQNEDTVNVEYSLNNKNDTAGKEPAFSMPENILRPDTNGQSAIHYEVSPLVDKAYFVEWSFGNRSHAHSPNTDDDNARKWIISYFFYDFIHICF